jgi:hypothetical protein
MAAQSKKFAKYLKNAVSLALNDAREQNDNGNLDWISSLAQRGVYQNWKTLAPESFLEQFLWVRGQSRITCSGGIGKARTIREMNDRNFHLARAYQRIHRRSMAMFAEKAIGVHFGLVLAAKFFEQDENTNSLGRIEPLRLAPGWRAGGGCAKLAGAAQVIAGAEDHTATVSSRGGVNAGGEETLGLISQHFGIKGVISS